MFNLKYIKRIDAIDLIEKTNGKTFIVYYEKKSKDIRKIECRLSMIKGNNDDRFAVYDGENKGVRHLLYSGVVSVIFEGECSYII